MNESTIITLVVLAAVILFPPADRVRPATDGSRFGDVTFAGSPEIRRNAGFTFISEIGGEVQIRFTQWFVQIGVVIVIGGIIIASSTKKTA